MTDFNEAVLSSRWRLSEDSYKVYSSMWNGLEHRLFLLGTTPRSASVTQLLTAIKGGGQYATQKRLFALFATVMRILKRKDPSLVDRTRDLRRLFLRDARPEHDALSETQLLLFADAAPLFVKGWKGLRLAAILAVLRDTGLRNNELLSLALSDVIEGDPLLLRVVGSPTNRYFPLSSFCSTVLVQWRNSHPCASRDGLLFVANELGDKLDTSTVWRQINRLAKNVTGAQACGIGVGKIRASVAKRLENSGAPPIEIQQFLGHKQETSTAEFLDRIHSNLENRD
jgi:integrase